MFHIFSVGEHDASFMIKFIDDSLIHVQHTENRI